MSKDIIEKHLLQILEEHFKIDKEISLSHKNTSVFLSPFDFEPEELVLLTSYLIRDFSVKFVEQDVAGYKFLTINNIIDILFEKKRSQ